MANVMQPYQSPYLPQAVAQQQPQLQQLIPQAVNNSFVWIQSEEEAKGYPVAPGNSVFCINLDGKKAYHKSTDWSGLPSKMRVFDLIETGESEQSAEKSIDLSNYPTIDSMKEYVEERLKEIFSPDKKKGGN